MFGLKIGMTRIFTKTGNVLPVTLIKVGPCYITNIFYRKNKYIYQLGYLINLKNSFYINKSIINFFIKKNLRIFKYLKEFNYKKFDTLNIGDKINTNIYSIGDIIKIQGRSIGKGTTGNIKQHKFKRGPMSHGSKHKRLQGSLGAGTTPGRVFPGKKMSSRCGFKNFSNKNVKIIDINPILNILVVSGSIPGKKNNILYITSKVE